MPCRRSLLLRALRSGSRPLANGVVGGSCGCFSDMKKWDFCRCKYQSLRVTFASLTVLLFL